MSLIGKKVETSGWGGPIIGLILDKYIGITDVRCEAPSGKGGVMGVTKYINKDYYLIEDKNGKVHNVPCGNLIKVLKDE